MSNSASLQNLVRSVHTIQEKIEIAKDIVIFHANSNDPKSSEFHLRFDKLMNKFSGFADTYRFELDQFHTLLLNNIKIIQLKELQEKNERERVEILKKLETISNSNNEIVDNLAEIDNHSSAADSIKNIQYESKQFVPIPTPKPVHIPSKKIIKNIIRKNAHAKSHKAPLPKMQNKAKKVKKAPVKVKSMNASKVTMANKVKNSNSNNKVYMEKPYTYNGNIWQFRGVHKSSTQIFIGNLPASITAAAVNHFVMRMCRGNVKLAQIIQTRVLNGSRGKYALVRFSGDVSITDIRKYMNKVNKDNENEYKKLQLQKDKSQKKGKKMNINNISWKKRVFLKFNKFNKFYKTEEDMYNDPSADCTLFIRNFDILDANCHYDLTHTLLDYGALDNDIVISVDSFGDCYCTATFRDINDAIMICNSEIEFGGRMLDMKYSRKGY